MLEAQKADGRKRLTKVLMNGGFGNKDIAGGEASEWVATGRADGSVTSCLEKTPHDSH